LPQRAAGAARGFIDYTLLSRQQAAMIAGGNLQRLLRDGPREVPKPGPWHDAITACVRRSRPVPCEVLDAHCHMGHDGCTSLAPDVVSYQGDAQGMIELARRMGINKTAIMSWVGPLGMDTDLGNQIVEHAVARFPDEFIGLATVNPDYDSPQKIREVIHRYHEELGFPGLKTFTPCQTIDYDDPKFDAWLRYADEHRLYMVFDPKGGVNGTACARNLARRYPNLSIHLDHCGQSWEYARWAVTLCREFPNFVAQLNFTMVTNGVIEYIVRELGSKRVLFGTDSPMRDPRPQLTWLAFTRLSESEKRDIFGLNFKAVLERTRLPVRTASRECITS
jgi:predicted TIM-barrel fold metal-dependent hydrolase